MINGHDTHYSIVPRLRRDLKERLKLLEVERQAIQRALAALEDRPPARTRRASTATVFEAVARDPGVRATMLALELGVAAESVTRLLCELQGSGRVEQDGLGWKASDPTV